MLLRTQFDLREPSTVYRSYICPAVGPGLLGFFQLHSLCEDTRSRLFESSNTYRILNYSHASRLNTLTTVYVSEYSVSCSVTVCSFLRLTHRRPIFAKSSTSTLTPKRVRARFFWYGRRDLIVLRQYCMLGTHILEPLFDGTKAPLFWNRDAERLCRVDSELSQSGFSSIPLFPDHGTTGATSSQLYRCVKFEAANPTQPHFPLSFQLIVLTPESVSLVVVARFAAIYIIYFSSLCARQLRSPLSSHFLQSKA